MTRINVEVVHIFLFGLFTIKLLVIFDRSPTYNNTRSILRVAWLRFFLNDFFLEFRAISMKIAFKWRHAHLK